MKRSLIKRTVVLFTVILLSACAATEQAKERSVFVRSAITPQTYICDIRSCDGYAAGIGASDGERTGAVAAGLILGGIMGAMSVSGAYYRSQKRLFEECMFLKGYRLVDLPAGYGTDPRTEDDEFDHRQAEFDLVQQNKANELVAWENAKNFGGQTRLSAYLEDHPNGAFVADVRRRLAGNAVPSDEGKEVRPVVIRPIAGDGSGASVSPSSIPLKEALSSVQCGAPPFRLPRESITRTKESSDPGTETPNPSVETRASVPSSASVAKPLDTGTGEQARMRPEPDGRDVASVPPKSEGLRLVSAKDREAIKTAIEDYYFKGGYDNDVLESGHDSFYGMQMDDLRRLTVKSVDADKIEVVAEYTASSNSQAGSVGLKRRSSFLLRRSADTFTVLKMWGAKPI